MNMMMDQHSRTGAMFGVPSPWALNRSTVGHCPLLGDEVRSNWHFLLRSEMKISMVWILGYNSQTKIVRKKPRLARDALVESLVITLTRGILGSYWSYWIYSWLLSFKSKFLGDHLFSHINSGMINFLGIISHPNFNHLNLSRSALQQVLGRISTPSLVPP